MTSKADEARAVVEAVGKRYPDALKLARAVSLASRVEPELLRKVRLELLPEIDAGAEADLWFSLLVQSSTPLAFTFLPAIADELRRDLAESRDSLTRAWQVVSDVHQHSPAAIKLEERVRWTILNGGPTAHEDVEKDLNSVVSAILTQNRTGLARWALRAVPQLPVEARQTKAAQTLLVTAAAHLGAWNLLQKQVENNNLPATFINDLKVVLPSNLPQVEVGVRLLDAGVELGLGASSSQSYIVEFSNPPLNDQSDLIRVPGTVPLLLEVSWNRDVDRQVRQLSLYRGRVERIRVGSTPVTIKTARGDVYTLSRDKVDDQKSAVDQLTRALALIPKAPTIGYVRRRSVRYPDIVQELKEELNPQYVRISPLIELVGPAGAGKSTVAAELARELVELYEGRVVWLSAEKHSDFNLASMLNGIATQLGKPELRILNTQRKSHEVMSLVEAEPSIIFIDDFESLSKSESSRCVRFLERCDCATVIVSRRLHTTRYKRLAIGVTAMSQQEAGDFLQRLMRRSSLRQDVRDFQDALMDISKANPLVLRLLFAQIEFSADPESVLKTLSTGDKRNTLLLRILDSSLALAGTEARPIYLVMALFAPNGSKNAIAEVTGDSRALSYFDEAVDKLTRLGLVYRLDGVERWAVEGSVKAILRGYQLVPEMNDPRRNYVDYFRRYAEQHNEATSADYELLEAEFENLLNAMDLAGEFEMWDEAIRIYLALNHFLDVRGYWDIALRRNQQAQSAADMMMRSDLRPQLYQAAGEIYLRRGEYAKAEKAFQAVLTQFGDTVNTDVADATGRLGSIALDRENLGRAKRLYLQALDFSRQLKLDASIADNLHNLAIVAQLEGKPDEAMRLYDESLRLSERAGDQRGAAVSLHQLGVVSREQGNYEQARNYFERSLSIKRSLGYREGMADTLHQLGLLFRTLGEKQQAAQPFQQALTIYEELQSPAAAVAASDLATLTTPARAKVTSKRTPSGKRKTTKATKSSAKKSAAKKSAAKKRRIGGISGLFSSHRRKGGRMGGRFGPRSRRSFR